MFAGVVLECTFRNFFNQAVVHHDKPCLIEYDFFNPLLPHGFLLASLIFAFSNAVVVQVLCACFICSAFPDHALSAKTTVQFACQNIICFRPSSAWRAPVQSKHVLNFCKYFRCDQGRNVGIRVFLPIIMVNADVFFVFQKCAQTVKPKQLALAISHAFRIQLVNDLLLRIARSIQIKNFLNDRRSFWIDFQSLIRAGSIAER